jgi:hypothetical protein
LIQHVKFERIKYCIFNVGKAVVDGETTEAIIPLCASGSIRSKEYQAQVDAGNEVPQLEGQKEWTKELLLGGDIAVNGEEQKCEPIKPIKKQSKTKDKEKFMEIWKAFAEDMKKLVQTDCGWGCILAEFQDSNKSWCTKPVIVAYCDDNNSGKNRAFNIASNANNVKDVGGGSLYVEVNSMSELLDFDSEVLPHINQK